MSVHHPNRHHEGEGVKLLSSPVELLELMLQNDDDKSWAKDQVDNEGPRHKQVFNALLLHRLFRLVRTIERSCNESFVLQEGYELTKEGEDTEKTIPISVPINLGSDLEKKQIADAIAHAPEHEILVYAMGLQVVEWAIKVTEAHSKDGSI